MTIGLIDVDGHNFPNLALMKLSGYHKHLGDDVRWWNGFETYDVVYMSKVFDETYSADVPEPVNAKRVVKGGTDTCGERTANSNISSTVIGYLGYRRSPGKLHRASDTTKHSRRKSNIPARTTAFTRSIPQTRPADTLQEAARTTARSASCRRKRGL